MGPIPSASRISGEQSFPVALVRTTRPRDVFSWQVSPPHLGRRQPLRHVEDRRASGDRIHEAFVSQLTEAPVVLKTTGVCATIASLQFSDHLAYRSRGYRQADFTRR